MIIYKQLRKKKQKIDSIRKKTTNDESGWVKLTASLLQPQLPSKHQQFRAA